MSRQPFWDSLWVHRCVACRTLLARRTPFLCSDCQVGWDAARAWQCGICGSRLDGCTCPDPYLRETVRIRRQIRLVRYRAENEKGTESLLIYSLKRQSSRFPSQFLAEELASVTEKLIRPDAGHWCVTFAPRSPREERRYGFDHARRVAEKFAAALGLPFVRSMRRTADAPVQKKVFTQEERVRNAKDTYIPVCAEELRGKRVLLVDDIVTTGATMAECTRVLRRAGAKEIVPVSVAIVAHNPGVRFERMPDFRRKR